MDTALITILVFIVIMAITALVFSGWLIVSVLSLIGRGIGAVLGINRPSHASLPPPPPHSVRCGFEKCRAINADRARFCRRCGKVVGGETAGRERSVPPHGRSGHVAVG